MLAFFFCFTETSTWTNVKVQGKPPVARCDHTWVALGNKIVVFGGAGDSVWYNDVHVFHSGKTHLLFFPTTRKKEKEEKEKE